MCTGGLAPGPIPFLSSGWDTGLNCLTAFGSHIFMGLPYIKNFILHNKIVYVLKLNPVNLSYINLIKRPKNLEGK